MTEIKKETKKISALITLIISLVALGVGFALGILFQKNQTPSNRMGNNQFQMGDRPSGNRMNSDNSVGNGTQNNRQLNGPGQITGEIIKIDDSSLTIKTPDGGSKIVLISDSVSFNQAAVVDKSKLQVGSQVIIDGTTNTDGSVTCKSVLINTSK